VLNQLTNSDEPYSEGAGASRQKGTRKK